MNASHTKSEEYTGVILNAVWDGDRVRGNIFCDRNKRFQDGEVIITSAFVSFNGGTVRTKNSVYRVVFLEKPVEQKPCIHIDELFTAFRQFTDDSRHAGINIAKHERAQKAFREVLPEPLRNLIDWDPTRG